jgi:hypothetical protein
VHVYVVRGSSDVNGLTLLVCTFRIGEIIKESLPARWLPGLNHSKHWVTVSNPCENVESVCVICVCLCLVVYVEAWQWRRSPL